MELYMRKPFLSVALVAVLLSCATLSRAQRPRRVGDTGGSSQSSTSQPPTTPGSRPPVLGGANYPNNQRPKPQPQEPQQSEPEEVDAGDIIKVDTSLVTIPVSVMDRDGRYVPNLRKADFRIWEDDVEQEVAFFSSVDKPFSVVLMLDTSPSTKFRLEDIQDAAIAFINQLRSDDKVMVVSFNQEIRLLSELTTDRAKLERAIRRAHTGDGTSIYDAVDLVINQELSRIPGRKAIVLFTDGVDTTSRQGTYQSNVLDAQELDALIYPVQYDTSRDVGMGPNFPSGYPTDVWGQILGGIFGGGRTGRSGRSGRGWPRGGNGDYELANHYLKELADSTGGREYQADTLQDMSSAFANVAEELRRQYSIGYYPKRPPQPGQRRQIRVRANQPNLAVRARDSYIFNPKGSGTAAADSASTKPPILKRLAADNDRRGLRDH